MASFAGKESATSRKRKRDEHTGRLGIFLTKILVLPFPLFRLSGGRRGLRPRLFFNVGHDERGQLSAGWPRIEIRPSSRTQTIKDSLEDGTLSQEKVVVGKKKTAADNMLAFISSWD